MDPEQTPPTHLRFARSLPQTAKNHALAAAAEFVGTFLFLLFALGGTKAVNNAGHPTGSVASDPAKLLFISACFGLSLAVAVSIFFRLSGGQLNPAVTFGLMVLGAVSPLRGAIVIIAQLLGGIVASALLLVLLPGKMLVATTLGDNVSVVQGLFIELFLTVLLVLTVLMLAVEKHRGTFAAPAGIGMALLVAEMMGIPYTGGSLNPARSFGPCVATGLFPTYHYIYWIGPIAGALVAAGLYKAFKALEYETVSPGQDGDGTGALDDGGHAVGCEAGRKPVDVEAAGGSR